MGVGCPDDEAERCDLVVLEGTVAADDFLTWLEGELLLTSIALLAVELDLRAFVCVEGEVLDLLTGRVVTDADAVDFLVSGDLESALKLLVLLHTAEFTDRDVPARLVLEE